MRRLAPLLLVLLCGCRAFQGLLIGGATGAGITKTPEGAATGAAAGFLVGAWDDITAWVSGLWHGWFGGGLVPPAPTPSHTIEYVLIGLAAYFVYKFIFDYQFRNHLIGGFKRAAVPTPKRKPHAP